MKRRVCTAHSTTAVSWSFKAASNLTIRPTRFRCCSFGLCSDPLDLHPHGRCPRGSRNLASHRAERAMMFAFLTSVDCRRSSLAEVSPRVSPACRLFLSWVLSRCRPSAVLASLTRSRSVHLPRCRSSMVPVAPRFPGVPRRTVRGPSRDPPAVFLHPRRFSLVKARRYLATRRRPWGSKCFFGAPLNRSTRIAPRRRQTFTPIPHLAFSPFEGSPSPTAVRSRDRRCPPAFPAPLHPGAFSSRRAGFPVNARRKGYLRRPTARCG